MARSLSRRRVEDGLVRLAGSCGLGHRVVDLQDQLLGAEGAVALLVPFLDNREVAMM